MAFTNPDEEHFDEFLEEIDSGQPSQEPQGKKPGGGKSTFGLAIGILGALTLLAIIVLVVIMLLVLPQQQAQRAEQAAQAYAANTATSQAATVQAATAFFLMTPSPTLEPTQTPTATNTPVVAVPTATETPEVTAISDEMASTMTLAAQLTEMAGGTGGQGTGTITPGAGTPNAGTLTATALPDTGIGDNLGWTGMLGAAIALVVLIVVVRRLRSSAH